MADAESVEPISEVTTMPSCVAILNGVEGWRASSEHMLFFGTLNMFGWAVRQSTMFLLNRQLLPMCATLFCCSSGFADVETTLCTDPMGINHA